MLDAKASDWTEMVIEQPAPFAATADIVLPGPLRQHLGFRRFTTGGRAAVWRFRDATLLPMLGSVLQDGKLLEPTRYCVIPGEEQYFLDRLHKPRGRLDGRRGFVALNRASGNYFHILTQLLPAIAAYALDPGFRDGVLLLGHPGKRGLDSLPFLRRAAALAGIAIPPVAMLRAEPLLDAADLTFASLLTGTGGPSPFCRALFAAMAARATAPGVQARPAAIYIDRSDGNARPLRNEAELIGRLSRLGVVPVVLGRLSLDEQILLFRHARLVIGPHGAGLANIVFSAPGTVLYDLLPGNYVNPCMNHLAQQHGVHYWCDIHRADDSAGIWRHQVPWSADIGAVERRVAEIVETYRIAL
jgi:hypothetical protein